MACYFHDPAMNIMELISFHSLDRSGNDGPFDARELLGVAEAGVVSRDPKAVAGQLHELAGVGIWSGSVDEPGRLAFAGEPGHSLILGPSDRPWLPQGRISEAHPLRATIDGVALDYDGIEKVSIRR